MNRYSLFALLFLMGCSTVDSTGVHSRKNVVRQPIEKRKILLPEEEEMVKKSPIEVKVIPPPVVEQKQSYKKPEIETPQRVEALKKAPPVSPPVQVEKKEKIVKISPTPVPVKPEEIKPKTISRSENLAKGRAIWYSVQEHGKKTASGDVYDLYDMTAAHASLPLLSKVKVKNIHTGRSVIVTINDRLAENDDAVIKLSYHAARKLNLLKKSNPTVELIPMR